MKRVKDQPLTPPTGAGYRGMQTFEFRVDRRNTRASRREIIASLQAYSRQCRSDGFGMRDYDLWKHRVVSSETIRRLFGSWGKALQAAGCRTLRGHKIDPKAMADAFKECWRNESSVPSAKQLAAFLAEGNYPFRVKTVAKYFGGLGTLAQRIEKHARGEIEDAQLLHRATREPARRAQIPLKLRYAILKRDHEQCAKCGASPKKDAAVRLEVDHIIPVAEGGSSDPHNLQTLCWSCNQGKKADRN